jgi:hypothetical protein
MSETTGEVRVRSVRTQKNDGIIDTAIGFAGGIARLGVSVAFLPLGLLPVESQKHLKNAAREMASAVVSLPAEFADIASKEVEKWAGETKAPKDELLAN